MTEAVDVVVVGAGAAGLAAAWTLRRHSLSVIVLEARGRIGGRAWTIRLLGGHPADLGCGWLHCADRNPWTMIARRHGFALNQVLPDWGPRFGRHQLSPADAASWEKAYQRFWQAIDRAATEPDRPVAEVLPADDRWRPAFGAMMTYIAGVGIDQLSVVDTGRYADTAVNWRVVAGYGTLIAHYRGDLPVILEAPVKAIALGADAVMVDTAKGRLRARAVIVTVPVGLLQAGGIRFTPELPDEVREALDGLAMGHISKLFLAVEGRPWDLASDSQVVGALDRVDTGGYHLNPLGRPLVEAYFGGTLARELEHAGQAAMTDFAISELTGLFGAAVRRRLRPLMASRWTADPWARGAYSYVRPGATAARAVLAHPIAERLFLAGEACSGDAYATAHGAYRTGLAAAERAIQSLRAT